jgi:hypothetical protein
MSPGIPVTAQSAGETARLLKHGAVVGESSVRRSAGIAALAVAMAKAQAEMNNPAKDSVNPHFKSRYADLAAVLDAIKPVLLRHGLSVMQFPCELDDAAALTTLLVHAASGEWIETCIKLRPVKADPQGVGSSLTYMRRYCLLAVAGVTAEDDDDGNAATHRPAEKQSAKQPAPAANGRPQMTLPQLVQTLKTKQPPADGSDLSQRVGWLATQLPRLLNGFDPADLDAAIGDALDLAESWRYETLTPAQARQAWQVVVDYAAKAGEPVPA